jgi:hypothetical protein
MLKTALPVSCQPKDPSVHRKTRYPDSWPLLSPRGEAKPGPGPDRSHQQAAQAVGVQLAQLPLKPVRCTADHHPPSDGAADGTSHTAPVPAQTVVPALPASCDPLPPGSSPADHLNAIRLRITEFDPNKAKFDSFWILGAASEVAVVTALGSVSALCGALAWLGNGLDASVAHLDQKAARQQYIDALAHRLCAVQAWKDLADHLCAHPQHKAAQDLFVAAAEAVKLLDSVLNSYENLYKPPTEAALRQERRAREHQLNEKRVEARLTPPADATVHANEVKALEARVQALPLDHAQRRKALKELEKEREVLARQIQGLPGTDPVERKRLSEAFAATELDIQRLRDHFKATARIALLRKPEGLGHKQAKTQRDKQLVAYRMPLEAGSATLLFASIAPELASLALELGLAGTGLGVLTAPFLARSATLDKREAALEAKLGTQNTELARRRLATAQHLDLHFGAAANTPHTRIARSLVRNQMHAMVTHHTRNKLLPDLSTWRFWKSRLVKRGVVPGLLFGAGAFCIFTALSVASAGGVAIAASVVTATVLVGFLVKVIATAAYRQLTITSKAIWRECAARHALAVLGHQNIHRLYDGSPDEIRLAVDMIRLSAPPELRSYLSEHKLRHDNPYLATEWMAHEIHQAALQVQAGQDANTTNGLAIQLALAMGLPQETMNYLLRGRGRFATDAQHLDECRKAIGSAVFQLPMLDGADLPLQVAPLDVEETGTRLERCLFACEGLEDTDSKQRLMTPYEKLAQQVLVDGPLPQAVEAWLVPAEDGGVASADRLHVDVALMDMRRALLQYHGIDRDTLLRLRQWLNEQNDTHVLMGGRSLPRHRLALLLDAVLEQTEIEPLDAIEPLPKASPAALSHELVAAAIKQTGKDMEHDKLKKLRSKGLRAFPHPLGTAKQLNEKDHPLSEERGLLDQVVNNLKKALPRDGNDNIVVPAPYTSVDEWLAKELPETAKRCVLLGDALVETANIGQEKQRKALHDRMLELAEATNRCATRVRHLAAAAA